MDRMYLIAVVLLTVWSRLPGKTVGMNNPTGAACDGTCRPQCPDGEVISGTENCGGVTSLVCCVECSGDWTMINGHCYLFSPAVSGSKTFTQARDFCKSYPNSDLATAGYGGGHDEDPLLAYVFETYPEVSSTNWFWLGATRTGPSTFQWVDGRSLATTSYLWSYYEPYDSENYECVVVMPRYDSNYKRSYLYDVPCNREKNFICEILSN